MTFVFPTRYQYLTQTNKILYQGKNLITVYLLHLMDYIIREYTYDELIVPMYSVVMKQIYGNHYSDYIKYLVETGFIEEVKKYSTVKHQSTCYKLTDDLSEVSVQRGNDYKLEKKLSKNSKVINRISKKSPIPVEIRQKLIDDLQSVSIDFTESINYLNENLKDNRRKYTKNLSMIYKIVDGELFTTFDDFGRLHTNFTNLKGEIRKDYLKIDGQPVGCLDVKSSQPFFLSQVLKRDPLLFDNEEVQRFIKILEDDSQDIYLLFVDKYPQYFKFKDRKRNRNKSKMMVIKSLFNRKKEQTTKYKEIFKKEFPFIFDYMENYEDDSLQELWLSLQRLESDFIFKKVYMSIINQFPNIKIITVHDSIYYPLKYHDSIKKIWDKHRKEMIQ